MKSALIGACVFVLSLSFAHAEDTPQIGSAQPVGMNVQSDGTVDLARKSRRKASRKRAKRKVKAVRGNASKAINAKKKAASANKGSAKPVVQESAKPVKFNGSFEQVICTEGGTLNVRDERLDTVLFKAKAFEAVKVFQGWGNNKQEVRVNNQGVKFVKVQFANTDGRENVSAIGWVGFDYVKPRSQCAGAVAQDAANQESQARADERHDKQPSQQSSPGMTSAAPSATKRPLTGLYDDNCCNFPLVARPTTDFDSGMRRFGARRSGGRRSHAGCDLYRYKNERVESVASGTVVRNLYYFYQDTYALEVQHAGGFVVRYGEVTGKSPKGVRGGAKLSSGQVIGYIGKVSSNCCEPMLHFELYSGRLKGSLSRGGNKYQRRPDLLNPSPHLNKWMEKKF